MNKFIIGISSCLLGEEVRYDGSHKRNEYIVNILSKRFDFYSFCPEVEIGLGIPRQPIELVEFAGNVRCIGVTDHSLDVTEQITATARNQRNKLRSLSGYIFKARSPSCGISGVKLKQGQTVGDDGRGIFAAEVARLLPDLPIADETYLDDPILWEEFVQRVNNYADNFAEH